MFKTCSKCGIIKELERFSKHSKCKLGVNSICKDCKNKEEKIRYSQNGPRDSSKYAYTKQLKQLYGLSAEEYTEMLLSQDYECAICNRKLPLVVDHDHETNKVRGLLCTRCNTGLGKLGDSAKSLKKALEYLERPT